MRPFFRRFFFVLLCAALWLNYGLVPWTEDVAAARDGEAAFSAEVGTSPHHHGHGSAGHHGSNHCLTAACGQIFLVEAIGTVAKDIPLPLTFAAPHEDSRIGSAFLDRDPPIPRFSV